MDDPNSRRTCVKVIIDQLDEAGAKGVPVSDELAGAIPVIASKMITSGKPRLAHYGAKLALAALRYNLERFRIANGHGSIPNVNILASDATVNVNINLDRAG
jgi:hypothetical protein